MEAIDASDEMSDGRVDKAAFRWSKIQAYLKTHEYIRNADVDKSPYIVLSYSCN